MQFSGCMCSRFRICLRTVALPFFFMTSPSIWPVNLPLAVLSFTPKAWSALSLAASSWMKMFGRPELMRAVFHPFLCSCSKTFSVFGSRGISS